MTCCAHRAIHYADVTERPLWLSKRSWYFFYNDLKMMVVSSVKEVAIHDRHRCFQTFQIIGSHTELKSHYG